MQILSENAPENAKRVVWFLWKASTKFSQKTRWQHSDIGERRENIHRKGYVCKWCDFDKFVSQKYLAMQPV